MRRRKPTLTAQVEASAQKTVEKPKGIDTSVLIPSGITLLNCACSDNPFGAFALGQIVTMPGGSVGGKTMLALTMLAECAADERFDDYDLVYDDAEAAAGSIDISYLFGNKFAGRLRAPRWDDENDLPIYSETIQDYKADILTRCDGKPFIHVLDSLDALTSDEELEREYKIAIAKAKSAEAVKELKGSYKTEKARHIGEILRMIDGRLKKTKSTLFIIQQTRAKIGVSFGKQTTTSGGNAPFFYSSHQVWLTKIATHTRTVNQIKRKIGVKSNVEVTKNKITGKERDFEVDIYYDYGVDDISCCVDFLVKSGHWQKKNQTIVAHDLNIEAGRSGLISKIENERAERKLQIITGQVWNEIEESVRLGRDRRF
jgi:RecA/RadA recombinase